MAKSASLSPWSQLKQHLSERVTGGARLTHDSVTTEKHAMQGYQNPGLSAEESYSQTNVPGDLAA